MRTKNVVSFIEIMTARYGFTVIETNGNHYDWGQALCRDIYGPDWNNNPNIPDEPPIEVYAVMKKWLQEDFPSWMQKPVPFATFKETKE